MEVIADPGLPRADESRGIADFKVGIIASLPICPTSRETRAAVHRVAEKLRGAGATVETEVALPFDPEEMMRVYMKVRAPRCSARAPARSARQY